MKAPLLPLVLVLASAAPTGLPAQDVAYPPAPGDRTSIVDRSIPIGVDLPSFQALFRAYRSGDRSKMSGMIAEGRGFLLLNGSEVLVLAVEGDTAQIRVLPGLAHEGKEGYTSLAALAPVRKARPAAATLPPAPPGNVRMPDGRLRPMTEREQIAAARARALAELRAKQAGTTESERATLAAQHKDELAATKRLREQAEREEAARKASTPAIGMTREQANVVYGRMFRDGVNAAVVNGRARQQAAMARFGHRVPGPLPDLPLGVSPTINYGGTGSAPGSRLCGKLTRDGSPCQRPVAFGNACPFHGY